MSLPEAFPNPENRSTNITLGASKAMLDVVGKPMIQWVLDALEGAQTIDGIVIIGLPPESEISLDEGHGAHSQSRGDGG